jgi:hypothetical protein
MENKSSVNFHWCGSGDAGVKIDSRVDDLCNHVCFTDVAAPRGCWRHFEEKGSKVISQPWPPGTGGHVLKRLTISPPVHSAPFRLVHHPFPVDLIVCVLATDCIHHSKTLSYPDRCRFYLSYLRLLLLTALHIIPRYRQVHRVCTFCCHLWTTPDAESVVLCLQECLLQTADTSQLYPTRSMHAAPHGTAYHKKNL